MTQFHVLRKDGQLIASVGTLGQAMDHMGTGLLLFMGTNTDAVRIAVALGRGGKPTERISGTDVLLHLGLEK